MSNEQLVYIDTNVFAILLLTHPESQDQYVKQANKFILDIESGRYSGITSTLTETEFRGVAKRRISQDNKSQITLQEEDSTMNRFNRFIQDLGIGLVDSDVIAPEISGELRIFRSIKNMVRASNPVYMANRWKVIRSVDALMAYLAIRIGADLFATFDGGFKGFKDSLIMPLIISDVY